MNQECTEGVGNTKLLLEWSSRFEKITPSRPAPLHANGPPHRHAADSDGAVLATARRRKERTYPELVGPESRARLVVLALETGGRWSDEAMTFVRLLARAKVE